MNPKAVPSSLWAILILSWLPCLSFAEIERKEKIVALVTRVDAPQKDKADSAGGAEFGVIATRPWARPAAIYGEFETHLAMRITNRGKTELVFDPGDGLRVSLKSADGRELVVAGIPRRFLPDKPVRIAAGKGEVLKLPIHLFHTRISTVCLGLKSDAGWVWLTGDIQPGTYRLSLSCENPQGADGSWRGRIQTEALEIEVRKAG